MTMWLASLAVAAPLSWQAVQPVPDAHRRAATLAPDGEVLVWAEGAIDDVTVVAAPVATFDDPTTHDRLELPDGAPWHATPMDGGVWVWASTDQGLFRAWWTDGAWRTDDLPTRFPRGAAAAPDAVITYTERRRGLTLTRLVDGEPTGTWRVPDPDHAHALLDETATPRALYRPRRRTVKIEALPGEPRPRLPRFTTFPTPEGGPLWRRTGRRLVALAADHVYALELAGSDHTQLVRYTWDGARQVVFGVPGTDLLAASTHPDTGVPDLVFGYGPEPAWVAVDPDLTADLTWVQDAVPGTGVQLQRARGDRLWHLCGSQPHTPLVCVLADRDTHTLTVTREVPQHGAGERVPRTHPVVITTPDGLELDSYLVFPSGVAGPRPDAPLPTVIRMHGGPYARASFQWGPTRSLLASRGYAVLELNYRGSVYMGASVLTGADGERGRGTQEDVRTATDWLIAQGIADPDRIALMGHSFGGYATLLGLGHDPERYACGVALAPTAAWSYRALVWALPRALRDRAPYTLLDRVVDPLLVVHGTRDDVLPVRESRHVHEVLTRLGRPVTYLEVDDDHNLEGDGIPEAIAAATVAHLAACLGGDPTPP